VGQKSTQKQATGMNNSISISSGADDSTSGGGTSGSENSTERSLNDNQASNTNGNPLTNPLLRSPVKKTKTIINSKLIV
jgi:hypothetical protein